MKPIKLTIKGLNSFIEEQTIDFEKLTSRGLFGIFGPTGSGKSTILDGITLALYGDIARKSSDFINTNCNELSVSYTFQISGTPNRVYVVSRHFKRDKKTGNAKTHAAVVKEVTMGQEEIIAESVTTVNKACRDILGLSLEDFTRTVVLPQGKFSEFLKLEGRQRREMLERLFNLQDYGDKLNQKLAAEINANKEEANKLLGEFNTYEGITDERLKEEKERLGQLSGVFEEAKKKQSEIELSYKKGEEIWNMQNELTLFRAREKELDAQAESIELAHIKVKQAESAAKVAPFLDAYEKTQKEWNDEQKAHILLVTQYKELTLNKQEIEVLYEAASKEKEEKLPYLKEQKGKLEEAIEEGSRLVETEEFLCKVENGLRTVVNDINLYSIKEKEQTKRIEEAILAIDELKIKEENYKVEEVTRLKVQEGLSISQRYETQKQALEKATKSYEEIEGIKKAEEVEHAKVLKALLEKQTQLDKQLALQKAHLEKVPISREALLEKQEKLVDARGKHKRLEKVGLELDEHTILYEKLSEEVKALTFVFEEKKKCYELDKKAFEQASLDNLTHTLRANLTDGMPCPVCGSTTHFLEQLDTHGSEGLNQLEERIKVAEENYKVAEQALKACEMKINIEELNIKRLQEEKAPLASYFNEVPLVELEKAFEGLSASLKQYEEIKEQIETDLAKLKEEKTSLEANLGKSATKLEENSKQLSRLNDEINEMQKALCETKVMLVSLKAEVKTDDFKNLSQEILEKDRKREEIAQQIIKQTKVKETLMEERENTKQYLNNRQVKLGSGLVIFDETQKKKEELLFSIGNRVKSFLGIQENKHLELKQSIESLGEFLKAKSILKEMLKGTRRYENILQIKDKPNSASDKMAQNTSSIKKPNTDDAGNDKAFIQGETFGALHAQVALETLEEWFTAYPLLEETPLKFNAYLKQLMEVLVQTITAIEDSFNEIEKRKGKIDLEYESVTRQLLEVKTKLEECEKRLQLEKDHVEKQLQEEKLTKEEVKLYLMTKDEMEHLRKQISDYREERAKLTGSIETVTSKLGNQRLEEAQWLDLQSERKEVSIRVQEINESYIKLVTLVKQIETALTKMGELRQKQQKIEHKLAILGDLDKLFKGKRFVEFVAITRLKYISLEASKKLQEITNGIYGLEVDEDGKFMIRDYKNGGAQRDASTLSGGETFLASLALALALSAEIQLKGTAPLELFFLDEGFGTLDEDLLEVVMNSLERIHHDKLKVGIISHVEAIKNRVPVKLVLTPAEAGNGGTKVRLERS